VANRLFPPLVIVRPDGMSAVSCIVAPEDAVRYGTSIASPPRPSHHANALS
jgi:hypothetical protein